MGKPSKIIPFDKGRALEQTDRPLGELEDDELMLMARGGVDEAFDALIKRYQNKALRVSSRLLGHTEFALDAAQNAFFDIFRALDSYQPRGRFRSYLYRILLNQCHMAKRSAGRQERIAEKLARQPRLDGDHPEKQVLARERRRELERALGKLSEKLRNVLVLRFVADLSYSEIGEVLKIPKGTVKSRMFSGLERLRVLLEGKRP